MGWWINGFIAAGSAYVLWFVLVILYVRSLKEIKRSSPLFRFADSDYGIIPNQFVIQNSCDYGKALLVAPLAWCFLVPFALVFACLIAVLVGLLVVLVEKITFPFFTGYCTDPPLFSRAFWTDLWRDRRARKCFVIPPFVYLFFLATTLEGFRILAGSGSPPEIVAFVWMVVANAIAMIGIFAFTHSSVRGALKAFREKACATLPIVD